jgi:hypothetical protein
MIYILLYIVTVCLFFGIFKLLLTKENELITSLEEKQTYAFYSLAFSGQASNQRDKSQLG